jgi:hypothetical protein
MATSIGFNIYARDDGASSTFLKVAAASKLLNSTFSDLGSNTLGLTKLIGGAGLIPVMAGAVGVTTELGVAMGAAAGAAGIFALSAGKTVADMIKQRSAITSTKTALALLTPGTAAYATELAKLHTQQKNFNQDFGAAAKGYDAMTGAFAKFKQATAGVTENVLGKGFKLIASVLPRLVPVSNAAGKAIGGLLDDLKGWTKSPAFDSVLHWFETSGPKAITHFGHSVGNIFVGLGGILKNFVGPGDRAAGALERLTSRFAKWGNSKGVSDSVNKFLTYMGNNGPKITSVLASLAMALPKVASAAGGLGSANLTAISMFLNLLAGMPQGVFDVVVKGLFGILVAAKGLAIISGVNALITGMSTALTAVKDACLLTRVQLGLLWAQEKIGAAVTKGVAAAQWLLNAAMDANPIGLVVVAIGALVVGMVIAYKKSATFRAIVQGAFHGIKAAAVTVAHFFTRDIPAAFGKVKDAASNALGWVRSHWPVILAVLSGPFGLAVLAIAKNWDKIKSGASNALSWVRGKFDGFVDYVRGIPGRLAASAGQFLSTGKTLGSKILNGMVEGMKSVSGFMGGLITAVKNAINSALHLPLSVNFDKGPIHIHATVIPALARGTRNFGGGMALVGEEGPEIVTMPRGSRVYPHGTAPTGMGGGGDVYVTVNASGLVDPGTMARKIEEELAKIRRIRGPLAFQ